MRQVGKDLLDSLVAFNRVELIYHLHLCRGEVSKRGREIHSVGYLRPDTLIRLAESG